MPDFTFDSLNAEQGTNTSNAMRNAANAAADAVCNLYQNAPTGLIPSFGDAVGIGAFTQGMLDGLCKDRGKQPPNPVPPYQGGKCPAVYILKGSWTQGEYSGNFNGGGGFGPISGYRVVADPPGTKGRSIYVNMAVGTPDEVLNRFVANVGYASEPTAPTITFTPERVDGLADNCGNPSPVYPTRDPIPSDYEVPTPVGIPGLQVNVPVTIIPTLLKPEFNFRPEINVKVGDLNININPGGIDISLGPNPTLPPQTKPDGTLPSPSIDPRPSPPPATEPKAPPVVCPEPDFTEILEILDEIKDCACNGDEEIVVQEYGLSKGSVIPLLEGSFYVKLFLQVGPGTRYQASEGTAPDVHYAGWASFGYEGTFGVRNPVSFAQSGFFVPDGATDFSYSLVFNSAATARVYRRIPLEAD